MSDRKRLTTDNPTTNVMNMLNFAYIKNNEVYLRYGDGNATDLCDLCSDLAAKQGCDLTPNEIMEGACLECECEVNIIYHLAAQAAELRERLKYYEDLEEQGKLIVSPCKVGDVVYVIAPYETIPLGDIKCKRVVGFEQYEDIFYVCCIGVKYHVWDIGKTVFLTREDAERALKGVQKCSTT